jgi:putative hydrolase of the HAD superfamily
VIFDLFDTLVDYDPVGARAFQDRVAERLGRDPDEFAVLWREGRPARDSGSIRDYLLEIGAEEGIVEELAELRRQSTLAMLRPRPGAVETLVELRRRRYGLGLITVCSDDVPAVWSQTSFVDLFDATVFSCSVRLRKPDPRIYQLACEELGVAPHEALFVGDGANDELAGAERVGMRSVLILRPTQEEPLWEEARGWQPRVTSVPELLSLLEKARP